MKDIELVRFNLPTAPVGNNNPPPNPAQAGSLSLTPAAAVGLPIGIAVILALLGAIQPLVSSWMTVYLQSRQEDARALSQRAAAEATWLRSVLAIKESQDRAIALKFLVKARLVLDSDHTLINLQETDIPFLRLPEPSTGTGTRDTGVKDSPPPAPTDGRQGSPLR